MLRRLSGAIGNYVIVAHAEQAFPASHCHGKNALQFVVFFFVRPVHQSRHQAEAARVINGSARAALHKRARNGIHFHKAGIREPFLRGERVPVSEAARVAKPSWLRASKKLCVRGAVFSLMKAAGGAISA